MKFIRKREKWGTARWVGRKNSFIFEYTKGKKREFYVVVTHVEKDIRFNSLWQSIEFDTQEEVQSWCEAFKPENFECIGKDVNNETLI